MSTETAFQSGPTARSLAILIADDSTEVQLMFRHWLEEQGHLVTCVGCGDDAVRIIKQQPLSVVITEIIMPNGDGLEVILQLKKHQPGARVIAISAGGRYLPASDCLRVAKGLGAHEALLKPVTREALLEAVERVAAPLTVPVA